MGKLISLFFLFFVGVTNAQQFQEITSLKTEVFASSKSTISNKQDAKRIALNWLSENQLNSEYKISLSLISELKSQNATHYRYQILVNLLPIHGGQIKVKIHSENKNLISISASNFMFQNVNENSANSSDYILVEETLIPVKRNENISISGFTNTTKFINEQGDIIAEENHNSNKSDSTATVQVFYPDPLTSGKTSYGAPYVDNRDTINSALLNEHFLKKMPLAFRNDTFRLENEYFKISEHSLPTEKIWTGISDSIIFNRSEVYFEQINIFYHLTRFRKHLDSLNFASLGKKQIDVDAHGFAGADASAYSSNFNPPRLTFGEGGVDDGEDPGIIVHEYVHFLSDFAAPKSNLGVQRTAIDEGICDYFAISYNRQISEYRYTDIFKWDGHNQFWDGRKINFAQHYPEDINGTPHMAGGLFTVVLVELSNEIGRNNTDKLALEVMYDFMPKLTFPDLAKLLVQTEKSLFNEKYKRVVCDILWKHGLIVECFVGIEELNNENIELLVLNSNGFSKKEGNLEIVIPNKLAVNYEIVNTSGQIIQKGKSDFGSLSLSPFLFQAGLYFIRFPENGFSAVKLIVY